MRKSTFFRLESWISVLSWVARNEAVIVSGHVL